MAAELVTPIDEFSGMPLAILLHEAPPINNGTLGNRHHGFHPSDSEILTGSLGGQAVRSCLIQLVAVEHHNYGPKAYHNFLVGPPLPNTTASQFGTTIFGAAHYTSDEAIDMSSGEPVVRTMNRRQLELHRMEAEYIPPTQIETHRFHQRQMPTAPLMNAAEILADKRRRQAGMAYRNFHYGYDRVRGFFGEVLLDQDLSDLPRGAKKAKEDFLATGNVTSGMLLLAVAAAKAVEETEFRGKSVAAMYTEARNTGHLHPGMPPSAASLVKNKIGNSTARRKLLPELRQRLQVIREHAA